MEKKQIKLSLIKIKELKTFGIENIKIYRNLLIFCHYFLQFIGRPIRKHRDSIRNLILQYSMGRNIRILDFGCGEGIFSNIFNNKKEIKYFEVDKGLNFVKFAKIFHNNNNYVVGNENLCFKSMVFDFVILNNVLHHMDYENIPKFLIDLKRIMKKRSFLIIIELAARYQQKGFLFKLITYIEEKFKKINYCNVDFFQNLFLKGFGEVSIEKKGVNFTIYLLRDNF